MYGLPEDFDPTGFVGRTVEVVSFTANTVHIDLDGDYSLTVTSSFEHGSEQRGEGAVRASVPVKFSGLMRLIGSPVVAAEVERPGTLLLRFDDGQTFRCFDDMEDYESYMINCDGQEIIV